MDNIDKLQKQRGKVLKATQKTVQELQAENDLLQAQCNIYLAAIDELKAVIVAKEHQLNNAYSELAIEAQKATELRAELEKVVSQIKG